MLYIHTGRNRLMTPALLDTVRRSTAQTVLVVVPKQLTLQTERLLLSALDLRGSFRLQVVSAERLCRRIFDAAGQPDGVRIDDRGRVMLVRAAIRAAGSNLTVYQNHEHRRGFADRAAKQLEQIRQAKITPETLRACADSMNGTARLKLNDLAYISENYSTLIEGKYLDGESEFSGAVLRAREALFLRDCDVCFFGFDIVPPTLHSLVAAVAAVCAEAHFLLPLENNSNARDYLPFRPIENSLKQLCKQAKLQGVPVQRVSLEEADCETPPPSRHPDLSILEREIFADHPQKSASPARAVQLTLLRDPQEECRFAAALTRRLVMRRGWHWDDVLLLCRNIDGYAAPLRSAFADYDVPLCLSASRSAARHPTAECLITALRVIEKNYPIEDMTALLRTNLMPVTPDEADRLANFAIRYGLRGSRFLNPLKRGTEAEIAAIEPIRERFAAPLIHLRDRLRRAEGLEEQLTALFGFLTDIDAYGKSQSRMQALSDAGLRESAGEEGQVWNRILGTLDQMHALMGTEKLSLRELSETLTESLTASVIKSLPQSGDAVYAQSTDAACTRAFKAILILGAADVAVSDNEGLLTSAQKKTLSRFAEAYLGPDEADLSLLRRFYLKSALGMATDYVGISCALSAADGSSQRPSLLFDEIAALFPDMKVRGGISGEPSLERMLRASPGAAVSLAAKSLSAECEGVSLSDTDRAALSGLVRISNENQRVRSGLRRLSAALNRAQSSDMLNPDTAKALYGELTRQSVTRLERYAGCPFSYYMQYGLRPERVEPFALDARDEGSFFHDAVREFLMRSADDLTDLSADAAASRMDGIADALLDIMGENGPLGDTAVSNAERRRLKSTARMCAVTLAEHMRGSKFHTAALEQSFGPADGANALRLPDGCTLEGRIDRVDEWSDAEKFLRVIDYKRGGKKLELSGAYYGLQLQLPIYLAVAMEKRRAQSAGVYFFPLDEGIVATQSVDAAAVESERRKHFRMEGLVPDDLSLLEAMSPDYPNVLNVRVNADGTLSKFTQSADEAGFRALTRCAVRRAAAHMSDIRRGKCDISPAEYDKKMPCDYCDCRDACLFDPQLDAAKVRRYPKLKPEEAMLRMKSEADKTE